MKKKSLFLNILSGFIYIVIPSLLNFVSRAILINRLGIENIGLISFANNFVALLSFAELGIGNAVTFALYRPIVEKNKEQITAILRFFAKCQLVIAFVVFTMGMLCTPLVNSSAINSNLDTAYIRIVLVLYTLDSTLSYVFASRKNLLIADTKEYIIKIIQSILVIIRILSQIAVLYLKADLFIYIFIQMICNLSGNVIIYLYTNKKYLYIVEAHKEKVKLTSTIKKEIITNTKNLFVIRLGALSIESTDNFIITFFQGLYYTGIFSNYALISVNLISFSLAIFAALLPFIGQKFVKSSFYDKQEVFEKLFSFSFILAAFNAILLYSTIDLFMNIWLEEKLLFNAIETFLYCINVYLYIIRMPLLNIINAEGIFSQTRSVFIKTALINMIISLLFGKLWGISGVLLGTIACNLYLIVTGTKKLYTIWGVRGINAVYYKMLFYSTGVISTIGIIRMMLNRIIDKVSLQQLFLCVGMGIGAFGTYCIGAIILDRSIRKMLQKLFRVFIT